jgi:hypothetical protein
MALPNDERASLAVKLLATVDEPAVDDTLEGYAACFVKSSGGSTRS